MTDSDGATKGYLTSYIASQIRGLSLKKSCDIVSPSEIGFAAATSTTRRWAGPYLTSTWPDQNA